MLELKKFLKLNHSFIKTVFATIILGTVLSVGLSFVWAYSSPTAPAPGGNISAPINVGPATQTKSGGLNISGNVGIGTTGPGQKLTVVGDVSWTGTLQGGAVPWTRLTSVPAGFADGVDDVGITSETDPQVGTVKSGFICGGGNWGAVQCDIISNVDCGSGRALQMIDLAYTQTKTCINIPTDTNTWQPNTKTQDGYVTAGLGNAGMVWKTDVLGNPGWRTDATSDMRLKEDVKPITNALQKALQLRGVTFRWKNAVDNTTEMGFVAQEVLPVVPELVVKENDGYYGIKQSQLIALLAEAIKEQQKQIQNLTAQNLEQQQEISQLKEDVGILKSR